MKLNCGSQNPGRGTIDVWHEGRCEKTHRLGGHSESGVEGEMVIVISDMCKPTERSQDAGNALLH